MSVYILCYRYDDEVTSYHSVSVRARQKYVFEALNTGHIRSRSSAGIITGSGSGSGTSTTRPRYCLESIGKNRSEANNFRLYIADVASRMDILDFVVSLQTALL
jgi:hypothetical protein